VGQGFYADRPEHFHRFGVNQCGHMLAVQRLTKYYGALAAIQDLSFEVRPGEVLGLLGPNGSGKSTTVKILTGLLRPSSGGVRLDGADALASVHNYKRILGYVPEEPHLYSYLTGPEYLRLVGRLRRLADTVLDDKIDRFLRLLGIYDDRYQTLSSYSKGMRQKILIAAAVLHNPRIVVLDEPFSGLDVTAARVLKEFVRALAADGKMVVFSSHVLEVVEQVCSRVVILKDGRVVGHDSVAQLRATLRLPSLDAVFASLVSEERVDERSRGLVAAMKI
jgi:ABC-2 type transport system ATP-binding protein